MAAEKYSDEVQKNILSGITDIVTAGKLDSCRDRATAKALIASGALILIEAVRRHPEKFDVVIETVKGFDDTGVEFKPTDKFETIQQAYELAADQMATGISDLVIACVSLGDDPWMPTDEHNDGSHFIASHITKFSDEIHTFLDADVNKHV